MGQPIESVLHGAMRGSLTKLGIAVPSLWATVLSGVLSTSEEARAYRQGDKMDEIVNL